MLTAKTEEPTLFHFNKLIRFYILRLSLLLGAFLLVSCQTISAPNDEYALARAAIEAAKSVQAPRHSPGYWNQAEVAYKKAKFYYEEHDWEEARAEFIRARTAAEKAENSARLIRRKIGDFL